MRYLITFLVVIIIFLSGLLVWANVNPTDPAPTLGLNINLSQLVAAQVTKVFDGDTIEVQFSDGQKAKVRYLGIDTPETVDPHRPIGCYGYQASLRNKRLVDQKIVYLEKDLSEVDKYGRLLRYVYLKQTNGWLLVNEYLIKSGMGTVLSLPPDNRLTPRFLQAEEEARIGRRGLWKKCQ